jgi:hypothetical protein
MERLPIVYWKFKEFWRRLVRGLGEGDAFTTHMSAGGWQSPGILGEPLPGIQSVPSIVKTVPVGRVTYRERN